MIAIIPARSGSKGVRDKNIRNLNGKPLIAYTIKAALNCNEITDVIVSTDSERYASIARKFGALVPFLRPKDLSGDNTSALDVYSYVVNRLENEYSYNIDNFVVLLPTAPLRTFKDIGQAIKLFREKNADSVISVVEASKPISWYKKVDEKMRLKSCFPDDLTLKNRQDEEVAFIPNGAIYVFNKNFVFSSGTYYSDKTFAYKMPPERSVDIDNELDFQLAELLLKR